VYFSKALRRKKKNTEHKLRYRYTLLLLGSSSEALQRLEAENAELRANVTHLERQCAADSTAQRRRHLAKTAEEENLALTAQDEEGGMAGAESGQVARLRAEVAALSAEAEALRAELTAAGAERRQLTAEKDQQLGQLRAEKEQLRAEVQQLTAEKERLAAEKEQELSDLSQVNV
jgi:outer membrane murein-binding lipoprotein Lpp